MNPQILLEHIASVRQRVAAAASTARRSVDSVTILAVSKGHDAQTIRAAAGCGLMHFGESYLQEALPKLDSLADLSLTWHFIGRLQSNKTRPVAERFAWVHGIDRVKIAQRLSDQRPYYAPPLNVCLEVNIGGEAAKGGVTPEEVPALARAVAALPRLSLRGLMCIAPEEPDLTRQRERFARLRGLLESLNRQGAGLDTLSMGMSADLEAAVLEGATIVRVGTALFGPRP